MLKLSSVPLKIRLPVLMVCFSLLVAGALQAFAFFQQRSLAIESAEKQFQNAVIIRHDNLHKFLADMEKGVTLLATSPATRQAILDLGTAYRSIVGDPLTTLQAAYIEANPNPADKRALLVDVAGPLAYFQKHSEFHPTFWQRAELFGFYDVFLFDLKGNNLYTVAKEADFANNFVSGPYAETGVGKVFRAARDGVAGAIYMSDLEEYAPSNNIPAGFMAAQVLGADGALIGVLAVQLPLSELSAIARGHDSLGETGDAYLIGSDQRTRTTSRFEGRFGVLDPVTATPQVEDILAGREAFYHKAALMSGNTGFVQTLLIEAPGVTWGLIVEQDLAEVVAPVNKALFHMLLITGIAALVVLGLGTLIARSVTGPIGRINAAIRAVANGDLKTPVAGADRADEIGQIAWALDGLRQKLIGAEIAESERERLQIEQTHVVDALSHGLRNLAMGDLTQPITEAFTEEYDGLRQDFNATLEQLNETISQVIDAAASIRGRSTEISRSSEDLSGRTENQAATLEETAAALDELTASVKSAADGARQVEGIVRQARQEAEQSSAVVQGAVAAMTEIRKSSDHISQIIGVIDDIAFQTNLLALNAGVEAARAGDAGRGFAVVASEVRALAQRSSAAAKEIKALISASTQHVGRGVEQVDRTGEALGSIVDRVSHISTLMSDIAAGAGEQSTGLAEINIGITQLDQVTQQNAAMVEESTAASHALHQDASGLSDLVGRFQTMSDGRGEMKAPGRVTSAPQPAAKSPPSPRHPAAAPVREVKHAAAAGRGVWQEF